MRRIRDQRRRVRAVIAVGRTEHVAARVVERDPERARRKERLVAGIAVDATTWEEILDAGEKVKLARAEVRKLAGLG